MQQMLGWKDNDTAKSVKIDAEMRSQLDGHLENELFFCRYKITSRLVMKMCSVLIKTLHVLIGHIAL